MPVTLTVDRKITNPKKNTHHSIERPNSVFLQFIFNFSFRNGKMVVWSSVYRSVAKPGLLNLYNKPGTIQAIIKNGKFANDIITMEHTHRGLCNQIEIHCWQLTFSKMKNCKMEMFCMIFFCVTFMKINLIWCFSPSAANVWTWPNNGHSTITFSMEQMEGLSTFLFISRCHTMSSGDPFDRCFHRTGYIGTNSRRL